MSYLPIEIRVILRHYWKQDWKAIDAAKKICEVEGEGSVSIRSAQEWFKKFKNGDTSLDYAPHKGRPTAFDSELLKNAINLNPIQSTRKLSSELNASQSTITRHLHKLGKVSRSCRNVPHDLNTQQQERRIEICEQLLTLPWDDRFIRRIVTSDEKWVYLNNPNRQKQWLSPGQPAIPVPKANRFDKKVMLCVWWNYEGIIHFELIPDGRTINSELYCQQLERVHEILKERYPSLINRKRTIFQHDNAKPHTSSETKLKLEELEIEVIPHPAYSPDLAPSDFHLFRSMAHFFKGRCFKSIDDVENGCLQFFASKDAAWYNRGLKGLAERWLKTLKYNGLYFDE